MANDCRRSFNMNKYVIGSVSESYPEPVQEIVNPTMHILQSTLLLEETDPSILEELLCKSALHKFLTGGEMFWDDDEVFNNLCISETQTHINHLLELGLLDSIEDERGDEIVWVTEKGKTLLNEIDKNDTIH